jgi:hypothetical protein
LNLSTGSYTLKFKSANRTSYGGQQFMAVKLNGNSIYTFTPSPTFTQHEIPFSIASSGTNTLTFAGLSNGPDNTAFVDDVQLKVVTPPPLTVSRLNVAMDNGTTVTVDNISSYSTTWVSNLVLAADRSTREDSPYDAPVSKGLFKTGDRIVVSNNYLAWLDFTIGDGASSTHNDWARGGELAGYWRLDPATQYFKYFTTGPSGKFNWPRNMLVPGSASPANEDNFWDNYAPPTEHTIYSNNVLYSHHYAQRAAAQGGGWNLAPGKDGQINAFGSISYQTNAFMTSANNIVSSISSEVEYRFDQEEILSYWRFKPSAAVAAANVYVYLWMAYSPDANKPPLPLPNNLPLCDQAVQGRWPTYYATRSIFVGSNRQIKSNTGPFAFQQLPANSILQAYFSSKCPSNDTYFNDDINTSEINSSSVTNGAFLTISESNTLSLASRTLTFKYLSAVGDLSGSSSSNPANFPFTRMVASGERRDMVFGFGIADGPYAKPDKTPDDRIMLTGGKWYQAAFSLR